MAKSRAAPAVIFQEAVDFVYDVLAPGPLGCGVIDRSLRLVRASERFAVICGMPTAFVIGRLMPEVVGEILWTSLESAAERSFSGVAAVDVDVSFPEGPHRESMLYARISFLPIRVRGEVSAVAVLARDVTARTMAEQAALRSEKRFRQIVDTAEEGIWIVDRQYNTTFVNPRMARMLGYDVAEMLGTSLLDYVEQSARGTAQHYLEQRRAGDRETRDFQFCRKDGSDAWMLIATTHPDPRDLDQTGMLGLFTDITHRKHAELDRERLLNQERSARADAERVRKQIEVTLESITDGFISLDHNWVYAYVNARAAAMLDSAVSDLVGRNIWEAAPYAVGRPFHEACLRAMRDHMSVEIEQLQDRSGRWFAYRLYPSSEGLSVFFHEITERKRTEEEKEQLLARVQEAAVQQRVFLKDMLYAVTDKRLILCWSAEDLPERMPDCVHSSDNLLPDELSRLRRRVGAEGQRLGYEHSRVQDLTIAASEAAMNSIVHGGGGSASVCSQAGGPIQVWLSDRGRGIAIEEMPRAVLERGFTTAGSMGHGMKMMLQTVDRIWLQTGPDGTTVVLEQHRAAPNPAFLS